jgi:hypothetical protein
LRSLDLTRCDLHEEILQTGSFNVEFQNGKSSPDKLSQQYHLSRIVAGEFQLKAIIRVDHSGDSGLFQQKSHGIVAVAGETHGENTMLPQPGHNLRDSSGREDFAFFDYRDRIANL